MGGKGKGNLLVTFWESGGWTCLNTVLEACTASKLKLVERTHSDLGKVKMGAPVRVIIF